VSVARLGVVSLALLALLIGSRSAHAQGSVRMLLPSDDPFPAAPEIVVRAENFQDAGLRRLRLRLALDIGFGLVVFDSTIAGDEARFRLSRLLPENREIFAQATVIDLFGRETQSAITRAGRTGPHLQLVAPGGRTSVNIPSRRVTFTWRSAKVTSPPGPWVYELFLTELTSQVTRSQTGIRDTIFTWPDTLQANTPYRWRVVARLANGLASDAADVSSPSSFVITPSDAPVSTLLYQNFPNPFPAPSSQSTCLWFDLQQSERVELSIHDLRGQRVRTMVPGPGLPSELPSGRYGRLSEFEASGCDPRLAWDGSADDGRIVPPGIYLVRFIAGSRSEFKKVLFLGR